MMTKRQSMGQLVFVDIVAHSFVGNRKTFTYSHSDHSTSVGFPKGQSGVERRVLS